MALLVLSLYFLTCCSHRAGGSKVSSSFSPLKELLSSVEIAPRGLLACWACTVTLRLKVGLKSSTNFSFPAEAKLPSCSLTYGHVTLQFNFFSVFVTYQSHAFCRQRFNYDFTLLNNVWIAELQFSSRSLYINVCKYNQKPLIQVLQLNTNSKAIVTCLFFLYEHLGSSYLYTICVCPFSCL